jgi:hypothetical protein
MIKLRQGSSGLILPTSATANLLPIVLMNAANFQKEDSAYKKQRHQREGRKRLALLRLLRKK